MLFFIHYFLERILHILTSVSIDGTSTKTPTVVANATPGFKGKIDTATVTASSKKLLAPIKDECAIIS